MQNSIQLSCIIRSNTNDYLIVTLLAIGRAVGLGHVSCLYFLVFDKVPRREHLYIMKHKWVIIRWSCNYLIQVALENVYGSVSKSSGASQQVMHSAVADEVELAK